MASTGRDRTKDPRFAQKYKSLQHNKTKSLQDIERILEEELYASSPELRKPNRPQTPPIPETKDEEEEILIDESNEKEETKNENINESVLQSLSPKKILSKYRKKENKKKNIGKHCFFWLLILCITFFFAFIVIGERYLYDPAAIYAPLPPLPEIIVPDHLQKWTFSFPQPTNRDLVSVAGNHNHGFYIGGAQGTFLFSSNVEDTKPSNMSSSTTILCGKNQLEEIGNTIWSWIPTSFAGTIETLSSVNNTIYLRTRLTSQITESYKISSNDITTDSFDNLSWKTSDRSFDGNVVYGNDIWIGIDSNVLYYSYDGHLWENLEITFVDDFPSVQITLLSIAFGNGRFVVLCSSMSVHYSLINPSNGINQPWQFYEIESQINNQRGATILQFSEISAVFVALINQKIETSVDGIYWNESK